MQEGLESLEAMEYPGRIIILGKDLPGENIIVVYAITGRSRSSQARKLVIDKGAVWAKPIDATALQRGEIDLLVYPAIWVDKGIAISNGKQTEDIIKIISHSQSPRDILFYSLKKWDYEPDAPNFTSRISGCILSQDKAALSIIKRASDGSSVKLIFEFPLIPGKGRMITTYNGKNKEPLPSFEGEPREVKFPDQKPEQVAEAVYQALSPQREEKDIRVAVVCIFSKNLAKNIFDTHIINRSERIEKNEKFG